MLLIRLLISGFLLAHAAIHLAFVAPRPAATAGGPEWPFSLQQSWVLIRLRVQPATIHVLNLGLVGATFAGFALAAVAGLGVMPAALWSAGVTVGGLASLAVLVLTFHPWLALGVAIDLVMLGAVLIQGWTPDRLAT